MHIQMAKLNAQQRTYVKNRARGLSREQSAIIAGYNYSKADVEKIETRSETVQTELARIRAETAKNTGVTKEEVVELLKAAAEMARVQGDPTGLVAAARELGKMLGFYAPETKRVLRGIDQNDLKKLLQSMPEDELLKLANATVIDGTATRVPDEDV